MTESNSCSKCKSDRLIPRARVMDRGHYSGDAGDLNVVVYAKPDALIFKSGLNSSLFARVCGDCGYTELFVENPGELYDVYLESQREKDEG